jgi:epoxyqueuosine reductase
VKDTVRQWAVELGFDICRFTSAEPPDSTPHFQAWLARGAHGEMNYLSRNAHKRGDPQQILPGAHSIVMLASSYADTASHIPAQPRSATPGLGVIARYARATDYHDSLGVRLQELIRRMARLASPQARSLWYVDTGPILERDLAQRAGLGFIGKHTNLISPAMGNWLFLAEILTTLEFEPDPPQRNRCGTCTRCLEACPTQAITGPFQLDARRCISYLTIELKGAIPVELRPAIGNRIFGCDDCLAVCPWNRFARESRWWRSQRRPDLESPNLLDLLALDEAAFKERFAGTPILRAKRRGLLRNVCVALGNTAGPEALPGLERATSDSEPLIAEHAHWAMEQIKARQSR